MRPWLILGLGSCLLSGCPLEPLTVTGFGVSASALRAGSLGTGATVSIAVPGLRSQDAGGLTALLNGTPVPVVATRDGEVSVRLPAGFKGDSATFQLWRSGELLTSRDIAAQLAQGDGVGSSGSLSPTDGVTVRTNGETTSTTPYGGGSVTINITVPGGGTTGSGGTTVVTTDTGNGGVSATPTPTATPTPAPTPSPSATPTPVPTLVPVADQTPVPPGTGEVTGHVQF